MMRFLALVLLLTAAGCGHPATITKTSTVEYDAEGKILRRIDVETVIQNTSLKLIELERIKVEAATPEERKSSEPWQR